MNVTEMARRSDSLYFGEVTRRELCNKVARLESENAELKSENAALRTEHDERWNDGER